LADNAFSVELPIQDWIMRYPDYNTNKAEYHKFRPFFAQIPTNAVGVEVGTFEGYNALGICNLCQPTKLYCVDPYKRYDCVVAGIGGYMSRFTQEQWDELFGRTQLKLIGKPVEFIRAESVEGAKVVPNELDFVYLDGDHSVEGLAKDLRAWYSKVKVGGIFGGHDVNEPSTQQALSIWSYSDGDGSKYAGYIHYDWSDWWVIKQ
jgi:hypothetical protein